MIDTGSGIILGAVLFFLFFTIPFTTLNYSWQGKAIERGYALYCPNDGEFAWKGECKDD